MILQDISCRCNHEPRKYILEENKYIQQLVNKSSLIDKPTAVA